MNWNQRPRLTYLGHSTVRCDLLGGEVIRPGAVRVRRDLNSDFLRDDFYPTAHEAVVQAANIFVFSG